MAKSTEVTKVKALAGDVIRADSWPTFEASRLQAGDGPIGSFPGCDFRIEMDGGRIMRAVNVKVTGRKIWVRGTAQSRCRIEFVGDDEPSQFTPGVIFHYES